MIINEKLYQYVKGLIIGEDGRELYFRYKEDIEKVSPREAFSLFNKLLLEGEELGVILLNLDKIINVFYKPLKEYSWNKPEIDAFSWYLMRENQALSEKLEEMKEIIKNNINWYQNKKFIELFYEIKTFPVHYLKKENILFPVMEKKNKDFNGLKIMWGLHDEARQTIKKFENILKNPEDSLIKEEVGKLFFILYGLIQKEELILFPVVSEIISKEEEREMLEQSMEYDYFIIKKPSIYKSKNNTEDEQKNDLNLSIKRYLILFDHLPVDITYVDENNIVRYFNRPKDRFFPRSPAIIGRNVENCHPPDSVHVVLEIIESFRSGKKDTARFWINLRGKTVLIEYFAIRDGKGNYKGVLEVSQDISEIREITGEKRLLEWD